MVTQLGSIPSTNVEGLAAALERIAAALETLKTIPYADLA
jgi:hypothetical protein